MSIQRGSTHALQHVWDTDTLQWIPWAGFDGAVTATVKGASLETSTVYSGNTALTPKFAPIALHSSGANTLIAAVPGKKIRVLGLFLLANGAVDVYCTSGATAILGNSSDKLQLIANMGFVLPPTPVGWFETAVNTALVANLSAATSVAGGLIYIEV